MTQLHRKALIMPYPFRIEHRINNNNKSRRVSPDNLLPSEADNPIQLTSLEPSEADNLIDANFANYMERLVKLVPTEVLSVYVTVRSFWIAEPTDKLLTENNTSLSFIDWWPVICIGLVILSRLWGTRDTDKKWSSIQLIGTGIAAVSFVIWVYAMGHNILKWNLPDPRYAPTAVILWIFIVPFFYISR
ncbi:MAG: hypothetical protein F6K48_22535 [Okeania sp. SIO3H1]|nr:hypothetical protein [Okeania sp. SIO3H1]